MNSNEVSVATRMKVGIFTLVSLLLLGLVTVLVNDRPYWWRPCQLVNISVEDATGLRKRSGVRSLGLEIGYLESVILTDTHVRLGICITEKVEVLPTTRAYIRSEGFLGDRFVELKPVRYLGLKDQSRIPASDGFQGGIDGSPLIPQGQKKEPALLSPSPGASRSLLLLVAGLLDRMLPSAWAQSPQPQRQIPMGEQGQDVESLVRRVDDLVGEMTNLTNNLRKAIPPEELRSTVKRLNETLENASRTLGPQGGLNQTAQRTLAKLEDAIEQLRDQVSRVNRGEGSVGMLLNDPTYAEEIRELIRSARKFIDRASEVRFVVDIGGERISGFDAARGWFMLQIWPRKERFYRLGVSVDPRGSRTVIQTTTTTTTGGQSVTSQTETTQEETTGILFTGMVGRLLFNRFEIAVGALHNDGAISMALRLGPTDREELVQLRGDVYTRGAESAVDGRVNLQVKPIDGIYIRGGIDSFRELNGKPNWMYGGGFAFDDEDIRLLFALR